MRLSFLFAVLIGALGCASEESSICERLAACDELPEGLSVAECEDQAVRQVSEERLELCAECVNEHDCKTLVDACRKSCRPGD
jgi:hypothetical protein